jgi:hypothetical protein
LVRAPDRQLKENAVPISPDEVTAVKIKETPQWVFDVWDRLIANAWNGTTAVIKQCTAKEAIKACPDYPGDADIFNTGYLDIEPQYRAVGWSVVYDKAHYSEAWYEPTFTFKKK